MVTQFSGYSASGKQLIYSVFKAIEENPWMYEVKGFNPEMVVTADSDADIYLIVSQDPLHKLIVVDRIDMLSLDAVNALNKEINKCRNTWMLMCRNTVLSYDPGVGFSRASDKILVTSKRGEYLVIHDELS